MNNTKMDVDHLDLDYFARTSAYTQHIHRDVYPSIDPTLPSMSQQGKVVIITGAGSGLGATGIAPAFAKAGARAIVLVARNKDRLEQTATSLAKQFSGIETFVVTADVSDSDSVDSLFKSVSVKYGTADVLVNNAATVPDHPFIVDSDLIRWWNDFEVNLKGTYLVTRAFLQLLLPEDSKKKATIINMTSGAATRGLKGDSSYGISKLAVNRFTEVVALEMEDGNVRCMALDPGIVGTDAVPLINDEETAEFRKFALDTPELVGAAAVWLTTEQASFLNGRVFKANWSVDDMVALKDEILAGDDLKVVLQGKFGIDS